MAPIVPPAADTFVIDVFRVILLFTASCHRFLHHLAVK
ncbi:hypothetical protein BIFADO_00397 [Bifidobacterium adolescentis L2-32]|uniref:Uncharacterized protein n=1 Tax=Bifidobacterium adolescentis L2-32 TaxID=411481 RepID=A7A3K4_BIFAD|nr:hypothetical protein BIFADO_00397 [Bifidobacterium adolescentis L2-32]